MTLPPVVSWPGKEESDATSPGSPSTGAVSLSPWTDEVSAKSPVREKESPPGGRYGEV
ncbi:hypothetical protein SHKM778_18710 [Streptomyces sp. KM77-8]|uniref:Uncharacterized protein n=1 Tax=Streptomyces haneummycinicus TaxID=3074435 RepID=A0AAT9HDI6_9ACTN